MKHIEIKNIFLEKKIAKKLMRKIGNFGFITQINEVYSDKVGDADFFRVVLYAEELIAPVEKILKQEINWITNH